MSGDDNPRFNAGMGTVAMYAAAPVDAPYPGINPWPTPMQPYKPIEEMPATGLTIATGGPEPIEQILSRIRARIGQVKREIAAMQGLKDELAALERMAAAFDEPDRVAVPVQGEDPK